MMRVFCGLIALFGLLATSTSRPSAIHEFTEMSTTAISRREGVDWIPRERSLLHRSLAIPERNSKWNATTRPVVKDLTFLIPSQAHINLLKIIYNDFRTAIVKLAEATNDALDSIQNDHSPYVYLGFQYGLLSFSVICSVQVLGWFRLVEIALYFIDEIGFVWYPMTYMAYKILGEGAFCWMTFFVVEHLDRGWRPPRFGFLD